MKVVEKILWTQNETPTTPTTILINGEKCVDEVKRQKVFAILNRANQNLTLSPKQREKLAKEREISSQANFKVGKGYVYLQGNYLDKDAIGRRMPYMFLSRTTDSLDEALKQLKEDSEYIGRRCDQNELDAFLETQSSTVSRFKEHLSSNIKNIYKKEGIKNGGILIAIILIIQMIIKYCSQNETVGADNHNSVNKDEYEKTSEISNPDFNTCTLPELCMGGEGKISPDKYRDSFN